MLSCGRGKNEREREVKGSSQKQGRPLKWHWPSKGSLVELSAEMTRCIEKLGLAENKEEGREGSLFLHVEEQFAVLLF